MSDTPNDNVQENEIAEHARTFLCVVDESQELAQALRFSCQRAINANGRVALLSVIEPAEFQHWMAVGDLMEAERREETEQLLQVVASNVQRRTGHTPILFIRQGKIEEEILALIEEEPSISVLVLGAATGTEGPGPLVSHLVEKMAGRLTIPITIVPGSLSDEQIDAIT